MFGLQLQQQRFGRKLFPRDWDRCYDIKIFFAKNGKKLAYFTQSKAKLC
jgi:hypothetical protein